MEIIFFSFPLALIAFIFESYPRFMNRKYGVDIWTHLLYLKEYHKKGSIPGKIENGFLVSGEYDYPPVFILILSKFPIKIVEKYEFLFSPFFDFIHLIVIFSFVYFISSNILLAFLTQVLYILTPIIILENASATPRSLGYTLFTMLMISLIFLTQNFNIYLFIFSIVCASLILLTHRFTTQAFLFFSFIFSLFFGNFIFLLTLILGFIIATLASRGFYLKVLKGHLGNLAFWSSNIKYRFYHQVKGNIKDGENKDFVLRIYKDFLKFPPFVLEITSPWVLFVIFIFFFDFPKDQILQKMVLWVIVTYVLAVLTIAIPKLRFLGEGQRYLELSAFPASFLAANFLLSNLKSTFGLLPVLIFSIIGISAFLTIIVIQRKAIINEKLRTITPSLNKTFSYLKSLKSKPKLFCIPHQITTNTIYHTGCPVFVNAGYASISKISDVYPYIKKPIRSIMKNNGLDMILLNEDFSKIADLNLGKYKIIKKFENFVLVKPV